MDANSFVGKLVGVVARDDRVTAAAQRIRDLYIDGRMDAAAAGELLLILGAADRIDAHPDCTMDVEWDGDDPSWWMDSTGRRWDLNVMKMTIRDRNGNLWRYAGGFYNAGDCQPLLTEANYTHRDVPLCWVAAVAGPLEKL